MQRLGARQRLDIIRGTLERWRVGLRATGWHQVRTVAQLASKWNDLAGGPPKAVARGPVAAESVDWSDAEVGEIQI